jgi:uncharacterized metal-binding protein YceD (DUF177 family)
MTNALPLSRPVHVADVPRQGRTVTIDTTAVERAGVAQLLGIPGISELSAVLQVAPFQADGVSVTGEIHAHVTQLCVVTSEAFDSDVTTPVSIRFSPDGVDPDAEVDLAELADPEAEDPPDLLSGDQIDLGGVVAEFLALALDPYPRKPGAAFEAKQDEEPTSPFDALKSLVRKN